MSARWQLPYRKNYLKYLHSREQAKLTQETIKMEREYKTHSKTLTFNCCLFRSNYNNFYTTSFYTTIIVCFNYRIITVLYVDSYRYVNYIHHSLDSFSNLSLSQTWPENLALWFSLSSSDPYTHSLQRLCNQAGLRFLCSALNYSVAHINAMYILLCVLYCIWD